MIKLSWDEASDHIHILKTVATKCVKHGFNEDAKFVLGKIDKMQELLDKHSEDSDE